MAQGTISPIYDTELENIRNQLAYADALRKKSLETGGQMIGPHYIPKSPWTNFIEGLAGGAVSSYQRGKQGQMEQQQEQGRQDWLSQMPAAEAAQVYDPANSPGTGPLDTTQMLPKSAKQYGQEMTAWGMRAPRGMEGVQQFALQQAMTAPQREAERQMQIEAREREQQLRLEEARDRAAREEAYRQETLGIRRDANDIARGQLKVKEDTAQGKRDAEMDKLNEAATHAGDQIALLDLMVGKRDPVTGELMTGSAPHKGFTGYVGATWLPGARLIEGTSEAGYERLHKQITSEARLQGVQMMKGAGAVSNAEDEAAANALTSMSKSQSEKDYLDAAARYRKVLERAQDRVKRGVKVDPVTGKEYSGGAAPAAGGATVVRRVRLKDGRTGVEWSDGRRTVE